MDKIRHYVIEGTPLDIPLRFDNLAKMYIEEYPDFVETPMYTPQGNPIMFTGEDACEWAESTNEERCIDCGSCRFYRQAPDALIGVCGNEKRRRMT